MTRDDVKRLFPDATDDQITRMLNATNAELKVERDKADKYKSAADKVAELEKQLKDLSTQNLTEAERAKQDLADAQTRIAELENAQAVMAQKKLAMERFAIDAAQADKVIKEDGSLDYDALGQIITEKETAAALAKEQEIARGQGNPGGMGNPSKEDEKPADVQNVEGISFGSFGKEAQAARDYYK